MFTPARSRAAEGARVTNQNATVGTMDDFTQLAAVGAMLDRARGCLSRKDLPALVMSDPGSADYVAAYERVLTRGVPALLEVHGGLRLLESFDITENLLLSHTDAGRSPLHRWFSVLTACIELLAWNGLSGLRDTPLSQTLCNLLTDCFALHAAKDSRAPLDLLPLVCKELQSASGNRHVYVLALLCELLVARLSETETEAKCRELKQCHDDSQVPYDEDGVQNPWFVERPEFVWGAALKCSFSPSSRPRKELFTWLELVRAHFPSSPDLARETSERLLRDGEEWRRSPRRRGGGTR